MRLSGDGGWMGRGDSDETSSLWRNGTPTLRGDHYFFVRNNYNPFQLTWNKINFF